jgi:uncharacterized protein (TIGR02118 family)
MIEIAALFSSNGSPESASGVSSQVERLTSRLSSAAEIRGLVVSEVTKHLTESQDARALIQVWAEGPDDASGVLDLAVPGDGLGADVVVDAWLVDELVFRQPVERESVGASPDGVKLAGTAYRRDDFAPEAFFGYWQDVHAPISGSVPGLGGYVVSRVRKQLAGGLSPDALLELWWPDMATFDASASAPQQAEAWEDVARYAKTTGTFWLMRESVLIPPPPTGPGSLETADA